MGFGRISTAVKYCRDCDDYPGDDQQLLLPSAGHVDSSQRLKRSLKSSSVGPEFYIQRFIRLREGGHQHRLPSLHPQRKSSRGTRNDDPDRNRPFDHDLTTSTSLLRKLSTKNAHDRQTLSAKYVYCRDLLGACSNKVRVCLVQEKATTCNLYAIKIFTRPLRHGFKSYTKRVTTEFCIAHTLRHPNVVRILELLPNEHGDLCQVMEYCDAGSLLDLLQNVNELPHDEADCFMKQILHAVRYIHSVGVAHRNLKPENILLTTEGAIKITDFGCAECFRLPWAKDEAMAATTAPLKSHSGTKPNLSQTWKGTIAYMAPEQFGKTAFDATAGDMWAVGIVYFAMRSGRLPWTRATETDAFYRKYWRGLENGRGNRFVDEVAGEIRRDTVYSILHPDPQCRLSAAQALDTKWIRGITLCTAAAAAASESCLAELTNVN